MSSWVVAVFLFLVSFELAAYDEYPKSIGEVHEAFVSPTGDIVSLETIGVEPPPAVTEVAAQPPDDDVRWVPGYWFWDSSISDFVWITGLWRRPPPKMQWVEGKWEKNLGGWVWFRGFWSLTNEAGLTYIEQTPPVHSHEVVETPPDNNSFWMSGYWRYSATDTPRYQWVDGAWAPIDPNWNYVPAHYILRDKGYVFVPPYLDWPVQMRGKLNTPIYITPEMRVEQ